MCVIYIPFIYERMPFFNKVNFLNCCCYCKGFKLEAACAWLSLSLTPSIVVVVVVSLIKRKGGFKWQSMATSAMMRVRFLIANRLNDDKIDSILFLKLCTPTTKTTINHHHRHYYYQFKVVICYNTLAICQRPATCLLLGITKLQK